MYLNNNQKEAIEKEIKKLEEKSSAELVAVITDFSSSYNLLILIFSLVFTFLVSLISLYFDANSIMFFEIQLSTFAFFILFFHNFKQYFLYLLPKKYKYNKASKKAKEEFINQGLYDTQTKLAIMFFVSIEEKYVEIITDKNVKEKIDDTYWQEIVNQFIKDVKNKEFEEGYKTAIKSCSEILIENFPIKENDINELSNEVIEL
ncbi:TPM domain-containing protein [Arcobacter sp. KX21116]|jgi:putative membrane protein|uniref:TPM domain-containing protein n=1 Tax=Arcobacter iocasae TaxID=2906515 RepID=UPI0035D3EAF0